MRTKFPNPDDILNFTLTIEPDEGLYKAGAFHFTFAINENFPHEPPKVKCTQKIYHPNIDLEGNVCLNILREDWKPVLNLNAIIVGLQVRRLGAQEGAKAHEEGQYSLSSGAYFVLGISARRGRNLLLTSGIRISFFSWNQTPLIP